MFSDETGDEPKVKILKEFWKQKRQNVLITTGILCALLLAQFGYFGDLKGNQAASFLDLALWVLCPGSLIWEWLDFKKNR